MKKVFRFIMIAGLIGALSSPMTIARDNRNGRGRGNSHVEQNDRKSHSNNHASQGNNHNNKRPDNKTRPATAGQRPSHSNVQQGQRPSNNNNQGQRPPQITESNKKPNTNIPGKRPQTPVKPSPINVGKPGNTHVPGHAPTHAPVHNFPHYGRPHTPPPPPVHHHYWPAYHRPTPPPRYTYGPHAPSFGSILGMVIGTAFNASLNYLYNNGYTVAGCGSDAIYLNNVSQMNMTWPDAVLRYVNGLLASSQYIYSTGWNDARRYWSLYNSFNAQYGYPASVYNKGGAMSASWFRPDGRFVSINYQSGYNNFGNPCYYTTLTFGN